MGFGQLLALLVLVTTHSYSTALECADGWVRDEVNDGNECYKFINGPGANFANAQAACVADGGVLPSVNNLNENNFLKDYIRDNGHFSAYIGGHTEMNDLKWVDGTNPTFDRRPNTIVEGEAYVLHVDKGRWTGVQPSELHSYICKATTGPSACVDDTWVKFGKKCYKHINAPALAWTAAEDACIKEGSQLVSIHSVAENNFLKNEFLGGDDTKEVYTGGLMLSTSPATAAFNWTDGTATDFSRFPNRFEAGNAIVLNGGKTNWQLYNPREAKEYICKRDIGTDVTPLPPTTPGTGGNECLGQKDWQYFSNSCYRLFDGPLDITEATAACKDHGANLVSIHSDEEDAFVKSLLPNIGDVALTGGLAVTAVGPNLPLFAWNDNTPFDYVDRVPDSYIFGHPFVVVKAADDTNKWQTITPTTKTAYICKMPGSSAATTPKPIEPATTAEPIEQPTTADPIEPPTTTEPIEQPTTADPIEPPTTAEPTEPTITASKTTEGGAADQCEDFAINCESLKVNCLFWRHYETMKSNCEKTCDFCECEDKDKEACDNIASRCHSTPAMITKMAEVCPLTCKLCGCKDQKSDCVNPGSCSEANAQINCAKTCGLC